MAQLASEALSFFLPFNGGLPAGLPSLPAHHPTLLSRANVHCRAGKALKSKQSKRAAVIHLPARKLCFERMRERDGVASRMLRYAVGTGSLFLLFSLLFPAFILLRPSSRLVRSLHMQMHPPIDQWAHYGAPGTGQSGYAHFYLVCCIPPPCYLMPVPFPEPEKGERAYAIINRTGGALQMKWWAAAWESGVTTIVWC